MPFRVLSRKSYDRCLELVPSRSSCVSSLSDSFVVPNFDFAVDLVRGTFEEGGENLRLLGMVEASDGLIDFGNPEIEIEEASIDGETRTTERDENAISVDSLFAFVENELGVALSRDGKPSEETVTLRCCSLIVNLSSWCLGFPLSSDHGTASSLTAGELLALSLSFLFFKIK